MRRREKEGKREDDSQKDKKRKTYGRKREREKRRAGRGADGVAGLVSVDGPAVYQYFLLQQPRVRIRRGCSLREPAGATETHCKPLQGRLRNSSVYHYGSAAVVATAAKEQTLFGALCAGSGQRS